jgi:hypothetical protein
MASERLARYIQGIRLYCPRCEKQVTPITFILNDSNNTTTGFEFTCDSCNTTLKKVDL